MPPKKKSKRRGSQERETMSTQVQTRSSELEELTCVPETQQSQQAAGVEEVVVGVEDPLEMSDTEQGDTSLETQQDSDSSDEDIADTQDTHAAGETQKGKDKGKSKGKPTTREGQYVSEDTLFQATVCPLNPSILSPYFGITQFVYISRGKGMQCLPF